MPKGIVPCGLMLLFSLAPMGCDCGRFRSRDEASRPTQDATDASKKQKPKDLIEKESAPATFFAIEEEPLREALAKLPIKSIKRGGGGRSLAFKITVEDGTEGYFKPEQSFSAANWYSEVAAYYLDRELGFGRVAPIIGRKIPWNQLQRAAGSDERIEELSIGEDGYLLGAFIWWIPENLVPLSLPNGWENWIRIEPWTKYRISPMRRPANYREAISLQRKGYEPDEEQLGSSSPPRPAFRDRPKELSDLIVFDYLIRNVDRWGGHNTNVRTLGAGGPLLFFDNGAGFSRYAHQGGIMESRLEVVQRFRKETIEKLKRFDMQSFTKRLATDPLAPVLNEYDLEGLEIRRQAILEYVQQLEDKFGQEVYAWP